MNTDIYSKEPEDVRVTADLSQLNAPQYQAVTTIDGPVLVIAGAGSGKTRTLVYRVAHLLEKGVAPESILLLTFTRKAAQEMLWRAGTLLNDSCSKVVGGTFHGIANMLLRRYGFHLGFGSSFTIIDRADAEGIVNLLKSSLGLTVRDKQFPTKRVIVNMISGAVNKSINLEDLIYDQYGHLSEHVDDILTLRSHYQTFKMDHGLMDYDDLLVNWKRLLEESPQARQEISDRFSYIMVDEYQDTNLVQAEIVRLSAQKHHNVMVVGDDSQSIYSFRGADFYNIIRFPKIFPETKIIKLEENYRSSQPILSMTNDIIRNAGEKFTKNLFSSIEGKIKPKLFGADNEREEALFVVGKIRELRRKGVELGDVCVLFRSGFHSYKLEVELGGEGLDFEKRGGLKMTESAHMKDVLSFLRVLVNSQDNLSWNRIFLHLEKVGPKTAQKITNVLCRSQDPFQSLASYPAGKTWRNGLERLAQMFADIMRNDLSPVGVYDRIMEYYQPVFEYLYRDDYPKRQKDLDQLRVIISSYEDIGSFVDDTTLDPPEVGGGSKVRDSDRLVLSTIHSAKGLEWEAVFVIGLAEGRFPHQASSVGESWEEERRLLYVATTRAKKNLYMTYPRMLMTPDRQFRRVGMSPFLAELNPGLYERVDLKKAQCSSSEQTSSHHVPQSRKSRKNKLTTRDLAVGSRVKHPFFGKGTVSSIIPPSSVGVEFDLQGPKTLHLDYAKLTVVSE